MLDNRIERAKGVFMDEAGIGFFETELRYIKNMVYETQYADLKAASGMLFPISNEADPADDKIVWREFDKVGSAKIVNSYANDFPNVEVKGKENISDVRRIGSSYRYNWDEILKSRKTGKSLDTRRAEACRRANDQEVERIAWFGDAENNLPGFFSNANVPNYTVTADGDGGSTKWVDKDPLLILRDMNDLVNGITELTKELEIPDTLLLPTAQYNLIKSTLVSSATSITNRYILDQFLSNSAYIKNVISVPRLKGVGTASSDVMIAYKMDITKVSLEISEPFNQLAPQQKVMEFKVPTTSKCGGLLIYKPLSFAIGEGI